MIFICPWRLWIYRSQLSSSFEKKDFFSYSTSLIQDTKFMINDDFWFESADIERSSHLYHAKWKEQRFHVQMTLSQWGHHIHYQSDEKRTLLNPSEVTDTSLRKEDYFISNQIFSTGTLRAVSVLQKLFNQTTDSHIMLMFVADMDAK